jgi:hypothetical protein
MTNPPLAAEVATLERIVDADEPDWSEYERSLCRALALVCSASDLRALLDCASVGEGLFEGAPPLGVARGLLDCVERFSGSERVSVWAVCLRSAIPDFGKLLANPRDSRREVWRAAFEEHRAKLLFFAASDDSAAPQLALVLAMFDDLLASERDWLLGQLAVKQPDGAVLIGAALHVDAIGAAPLEKACKRLVAKLPKKADAATQWCLVGALAACLSRGLKPPGLEAALAAAVGFAAPVPSTWAEPALTPPLTAGSLLVALLVALERPPVSREAIVTMLSGAVPSNTLEARRRADLLVSLAISPSGAPITERFDDASPAERTVLETLAHPAYRDAHVELRRLGLWSHNGLAELVAGRGPRFRRVLGRAGEPHHALGTYRAAIAGTLSIDRAVALITEGAANEDVAGLLFEPAERAFTVAVADTPERRRRERDLAMRLIDWLREQSDDYAALLDRYVASPFVLAPLLLLALLDAAARGRLILGARHERVVRVGMLETPERDELQPLFAAIPGGAELYLRHRPRP